VPFKSHIKLAGPKQTHCVPFSLILPMHCITRLDFLYIHNCYDYYYYYYYYYMVALVIREKNYMAFANFIYAHTLYVYTPNVIRLQRQFHFECSLFGLTNTIRPFEFKPQCIVPKTDHQWC